MMPGVYPEGGASMEQLTNLIISDRELATITALLTKLMNDTNATSTMLLDKSGQVVAVQGTGMRRNATTLGALLAGVFSSSREVARLLDEKDFRSIFQQGVQENIYTSMVEEQWLLVIIFDRLTHIGLVKVLSKKASDELGRILERVRSDTSRTKSSVINLQFRSSVEDTIDLLFRD
jgi:predicted regulator of Ras-like GTPase activity (Roadblock/LC7/MglB family)